MAFFTDFPITKYTTILPPKCSDVYLIDYHENYVKVLDGCSYNGHYWVFAGGLTDVRTVFTVTDTTTGQTRSYQNPQKTPFQPIQDTSAFGNCP